MAEPVEWMAIGALVLSAAGVGVSAYSSYEQGKAQEEANKANARIAANQAAAQDAQAAEYERQAKLAAQKEGLEQLQGEQEAEKVMRQRAQAIGSAYANAAGNGLLVSGSETDTFAGVLKSQTIEDMADINTIKANTAMAVWSREEEARGYLFAADQARYGVSNSLISSSSYASQARAAGRAGVTSAIGTSMSGVGQIGMGAYNVWGKNSKS